MTKKIYKFKYEMLNQDGTRHTLKQTHKLSLKEIYALLDCTNVELIPQAYYPKEYQSDEALEHNIFWADGEGRFNSDNHRNPFMQVLKGNPNIGEPYEWDCVGNMLVQTCTNGTIDEAEEAEYERNEK